MKKCNYNLKDICDKLDCTPECVTSRTDGNEDE